MRWTELSRERKLERMEFVVEANCVVWRWWNSDKDKDLH